MNIPLLDLKGQFHSIEADIRAAIERVLQSQQFIFGPEIEALEAEIAAYSGCAHGIGVTSGTDAILVALMALGIGPGDEVVTTPYTFVATATCIARLGARAIFVDIDPATFDLDIERVEAAISPRCKAIVPVHLYGQMAETADLRALADRRGLAVVEDAAQAIGAEEHGRRAGSIGHCGCLSFFPSKNLGAYGDGGMVVTNDAVLADRIRLLRNQGQSPKYKSIVVGGNFRLDAIQAAVLRAKLPHLDGWTAARQRNAAFYRRALAELPGVVVPLERTGVRHVYNQFVVRSADRDGLKAHLHDRGIGTEVYYPLPMHLQRCFADWGGRPGDFPESEKAAAESLALPIYPELTQDQLREVVDAIGAFVKR